MWVGLLGGTVSVRRTGAWSEDLGPGTEPQLLEDLAHVGRHCVLGDRELRGDLAVGELPRDEQRDL